MQGIERQVSQCRIHPTEDRARQRTRTFGCLGYGWNWAPALRTEAWLPRHERIDHAEPDRLLAPGQKEPERAEGPCVPLQQALGHCNAAFVRFFAGRAKYPSFQRQHDRQSATCRSGGFRWKDGNLTLAQMDARPDLAWTRSGGAEPTRVTLSKNPAGRSFISCSTEEDVAPLPVVSTTAGIDLGLPDTVTLSTGEKVGNERFLIDRCPPSSRRCHGCGHTVAHRPLDVRHRACSASGAAQDRDGNAAQHIKDAGLAGLAAGLAASACGGDRPTRTRAGGPRRSRMPR